MQIIDGVSRTFNEYLLLPNRTGTDCSVQSVDLTTPLVRYSVGELSQIQLRVPVSSAMMQAVSSPAVAIGLARNGGIGFVHHNQSIEAQADAVREVKSFKAGFVVSDTNVGPDDSLGHLVDVMKSTGHSTAAVTDDRSATGRLYGLVSSRDFHPERHDLSAPVSSRMRTVCNLPHAVGEVSLSEANARLWDERLDCLPVLDAEGRLQYLVFRSDYADNKKFPDQLVDQNKRLRTGAGINTHDYQDRVPALMDAGADVLCFDSSDGYGDWQAQALTWVKKHFPHVPVGAGNVVDAEAFTFLADAGADFVKVGVGGGSICITRDQKGIGRGQASAILHVSAARDAYLEHTGEYVPVCSDGGLVHDYHIARASDGRRLRHDGPLLRPLRPSSRPTHPHPRRRSEGVLGRGLQPCTKLAAIRTRRPRTRLRRRRRRVRPLRRRSPRWPGNHHGQDQVDHDLKRLHQHS